LLRKDVQISHDLIITLLLEYDDDDVEDQHDDEEQDDVAVYQSQQVLDEKLGPIAVDCHYQCFSNSGGPPAS
jgi:hypothetical protein